MFVLLLLAIVVSAAVTIAADRGGRRRPVFYLAKPLTTALIVSLAVLTLAPWPDYRAWVLAAFLACLAGDIALMFTGKRWFVAGLASFLVGHGLLIVAFARELPSTGLAPGTPALLFGALFLLAVGGYARWLLPRTGSLKFPVLAYLTVLSAMVLVALLRSEADVPGAAITLAGAVLFAISDAVLAYRKFVHAPWWGQPATLASYYAALGLIAWAH